MKRLSLLPSRRISILLLVISLVTLSLMAYSQFSSVRILNDYTPTVRAIERVRMDTITAHLWIHEILSGDVAHSVEDVAVLLNGVDWYVQALLDGGKDDSFTYVAVRDPSIRRQVQTLWEKLGIIREQFISLRNLGTDPVAGAELELELDSNFYELLDLAGKIGILEHDLIRRDIIVYRSIQGVLVTVIVFLFLLTGLLVQRNHRNQVIHARRLEDEIRQREQAKSILKRSEELLSKVYSTTPDAVMINRMTDGRILFVNPAFAAMFKYSTDEALAETVTGLKLWKNLEHRMVLFRKLDVDEKVSGLESEFIAADGGVIPVSIAASLIDIEGEKCMVSVIRDISISKNAYIIQQALAEILQFSLQSDSIEELLTRALDVLLSLPTFNLENKGAIFLSHEDGNRLDLSVQRNLPRELQIICGKLPYGKCLCGRAARNREIVFASNSDNLHEHACEGKGPHGHYCVPIMTSERIIGVFSAYVADGYKRNPEDEQFLEVTSRTLALAIEARQAVEALRDSEELLNNIMEHTADAIFVHDYRGRFININRVAAEFTGYTREELLHMNISDIDPEFNRQLTESVFDNMDTTGGGIIFERVHVRKDGSSYPVEVSTGIAHHGSDSLVLSVARDITDRKRAEEEIRHMANHDILTGLPNRNLFMDRLEQALARCRRNNTMAAVMFLDLDNFKPINDTVGHTSGDKVLKQVAVRLSSCIRATDTVARFGGDEFIILMTDLKETLGATQMAEKINGLLAEPIRIGDGEFSLGGSIGIALYPIHAKTPEALISLADDTMYQVKKDNKNNYKYAATPTTA